MKKLKLPGKSSNLNANKMTKSRYEGIVNTTNDFSSKSPKKVNTPKSNLMYSSVINEQQHGLNYSSTNPNLTNFETKIKPEFSEMSDLIKEFIDKSAEIAEFHCIHREHQIQYENRKVNKRLHFVTNDVTTKIKVIKENDNNKNNNIDLDPKYNKYFICNKFKVIYHLNINSNLSQFEIPLNSNHSEVNSMQLTSENKIKLFNIFEKEQPLMDALLTEGNLENKFVILNLMYDNLNFCTFNLKFDTFETSKSELINSNVLVSSTKPLLTKYYSEIFKLKSKYFNFKPFLPYLNSEFFKERKFSEFKIINEIALPESNKNNCLVLNFTAMSDRLIIFNPNSHTVVYNIVANPLDFTRISFPDLNSCYEYLIKKFLNKPWTLTEADVFIKLVEDILSDKNNKNNYKELANLIAHVDCDRDHQNFLNLNVENTVYMEANSNANLFKKINKIFYCVNKLICHTIEFSARNNLNSLSEKIFDFWEILNVLMKFMKNLKILSNLFETEEYDEIIIKENFSKGNTKAIILLLKMFKRNLDVKKFFKSKDSSSKERKNYLSISDALKFLWSIPMGMTDNEIESLIRSNNINELNGNNLFIIDEFNNIIYPFLSLNEEYKLIKAIYQKKSKPLGKFHYGYFRKNEISHCNFKFVYDLTRRKKSQNQTELENILTGIKKDIYDRDLFNSSKHLKDDKLNKLLNLFSFKMVKISISNLIYISHLCLFIAISNNKHDINIYLMKINPTFNNKSRIKTNLNIIGIISTQSLYNPDLLSYISNKNLLISQSINKKNTSLIIIDIYKDIINKFQTNNLWKLEPKTKVKAISHAKIVDFQFLSGVDAFVIRNELSEIKIVNPRSCINELSYKYINEKISEENVYDRICRLVCEKPIENTGDPCFKVLKAFSLNESQNTLCQTKVLPFINSQKAIRHPLDCYISLSHNRLDRTKIYLNIFNVIVMNLTVPAKSVDNPILDKEFELLDKIALKEKKRIINEIIQIEHTIYKTNKALENFSKLPLNVKHNDTINVLTQKNKKLIKDTLINSKNVLESNIELDEVTSIFDFISLLRRLNILNEFSQVLDCTSINTFSNVDIVTATNQSRKISSILNSIGISILSLFKHTKNNNHVFITEMKTDQLINKISSKFISIIEKFNSIDSENHTNKLSSLSISLDQVQLLLNQFIKQNFENQLNISYQSFMNTMFKSKLYSSFFEKESPNNSYFAKIFKIAEKKLKYSNGNNLKIRTVIRDKQTPDIYQSFNKFPIKDNSSQIDVNNFDSIKIDEDIIENHSRFSPLQSGIKKLAKAFLDHEIKLEKSFKIFDRFDEEIIDKKQFLEGLKEMKIIEKLHKLEIEAIFKQIDTNNSNCVTEEEYLEFIRDSNFYDVIKEIKKDANEKLRDRHFKYLNLNFLNPKSCEEKFESIINVKKLFKTFDEDFVYLSLYKYFEFLETKLGIQIELSYKIFDQLHIGIIFYNQFVNILNQNKSGLKLDEIEAIFQKFDTNKKLFIYEEEYLSLIKEILYSPKSNKKKYIKAIREFKDNFNQNNFGESITKSSNFQLQDFEYFCILLNIAEKFVNFSSSSTNNKIQISDLIFVKIEYLTTEMLIHKVKKITWPISQFELKQLINYYLDVDNSGIVFKDEFHERIKIITNAFMKLNNINYIDILANSNTNSIIKNVSNSDTNQDNNNKITSPVKITFKNSEPSIYYVLQLIQTAFFATEMNIEDIFYTLDKDKKGFLLFSWLLDALSIKFNINLTINQHLIFFNYLDKDRDGLVLFTDFQNFMNTNFSTLTFEDKSIEINSLTEKMQENFLTFIKHIPTYDIRSLYDAFDVDSSNGFLTIDAILGILRNIFGVDLNIHDAKLLIRNLLPDKKQFHLQNEDFTLSLREFLLILEIIGVNTVIITKYNELNEIVDSSVIEMLNRLIFKKNVDISNVISLNNYLQSYDMNGDGMLHKKDFNKLLVNDLELDDNSRENLNSRFFSHGGYCDDDRQNTKTDSKISILNLAFSLNYFYNFFYSMNVSKSKRIPQFIVEKEKLKNFKIPNLNDLSSFTLQLKNLSTDFNKFILKGIFSGLITISKSFENKNFINALSLKIKYFRDNLNLILNKANKILNTYLNERILNKETDTVTQEKTQKVNFNEELIDLSLINLPVCRVNILDQREIFDKQTFDSNIGTSFNYFHSELEKVVKVTKYFKSLLIKSISQTDNHNLLNHVEYSLKVNNYLNNNCDNNPGSNKSTFDNSSRNFLFRNYGIFIRDIIITHTKKPDEEIYIVDEYIDTEEYISFDEFIKTTGGILNIPELSESDIVFYIIRYWGRLILEIFSYFREKHICIKYLNLNDLFFSRDGSHIKLKNLQHYSYLNLKSEITSGPDLRNIFLLYNKPNLKIVEDNLSNAYQLSFDDYDDPFVSPELVLKSAESHTSKVDTWLFGVILFSLLFGRLPISYIAQLKQWIDNDTNIIFEKIIFPNNITSDTKNHFFYDVFSNIKNMEMSECINNESFLKLKSFSAIAPKKFLNKINEDNKNINGIGIILDLINSCMMVDPVLRPDLIKLFKSDLFKLEESELIHVGKFLPNCLSYFSPDVIVIKNILIPLRSISAKIIENKKSILQYENFILNVLSNLNEFFFSKKFVRINGNSNLEIIKYVFKYKILEICNFLILRNFTQNLKIFKKEYEKKYEEILRSNRDNKILSELKKQKYTYYQEEMEKECGRLLGAYIDFLKNCITSMSNVNNKIIAAYVENILDLIIRLTLGEEYTPISNLLLVKLQFKNKQINSEMQRYIYYRTFFRNEFEIDENFKEDEADKIWSIVNNNIDLYARKSHWSSELYLMVKPLFIEAFTESGNGNYKYPPIKRFLKLINDHSRNIQDNLDNIFISNVLYKYYQLPRKNVNTQFYLTQGYVLEILSLNECVVNIVNSPDSIQINSSYSSETSYSYKKFANKKSAISYLNSIFKLKVPDKIRACFDFKIHFVIEKFLILYFNDNLIKFELLQLLKEISFGIVNLDDISWLFGSNHTRLIEKTVSNKAELIESITNVNEGDSFDWDSNMSLVQFLNKTLYSSHSFILNFTHRFIGFGGNLDYNNFPTTVNDFDFKQSANIFIKELSKIFSNPTLIRPLLRILQKSSESIQNRQISLEIIFNLILSGDSEIIQNLNTTMCNFYETLLILFQNQGNLLANSNNYTTNEETNWVNMFKANTLNNFKMTVRNIIYILIEIENPLLRNEIFKSLPIQKFLRENNFVNFDNNPDIEEIHQEFCKLSDIFCFTNHLDEINKLINSFKNCLQNYHIADTLAGIEMIKQDDIKYIHKCFSVLIHIFNVEWSEGLKSLKKNCLIFNIVKLFEWVCKKNLYRLLFNIEDTNSIILSIMTKVKEFYVGMEFEDEILITSTNAIRKDYKKGKNSQMIPMDNKNKNTPKTKNKMNTNQNKQTKCITLQKIYHLICIKLLSIVYTIFSSNDEIYSMTFERIKFGMIISDLMKAQYGLMNHFLDQNKNDFSILNNYIHENKLRQNFLNSILLCRNEEIKIQFLDSNFVEFIFSKMLNDYRKFNTDFKKLSLEFLVYKESFPIRLEAISFIHLICKTSKKNFLIFDEMVKNMKRFKAIANELIMIKNYVKGNRIHSTFLLFSVLLNSKERDLIAMIDAEKCEEYFKYCLEKDPNLKRNFPEILNYLGINI